MADSHDHLRAIQSYNTAEGNLAETSTILFPGSELTVRSFTSPVSSPVIKAIRMFVSIFTLIPVTSNFLQVFLKRLFLFLAKPAALYQLSGREGIFDVVLCVFSRSFVIIFLRFNYRTESPKEQMDSASKTNSPAPPNSSPLWGGFECPECPSCPGPPFCKTRKNLMSSSAVARAS